ncbi:MAG: PilW family protein [Pseudomonadota bacterium]|nr:PilW family protein [Pseudomonadota bacterium]
MIPARTRRAVGTGFSLIELLVSMAIALVVTLAVTTVLVLNEGNKRSTTSVNDVNQTGTYVAYVLDRSIRSAGSGFSQRWRDAYGCLINASKTETAILPMPVAFPASSPFANVPKAVRLAPVLIGKNMANTATQVRGDVLTVMGGTAGFSETPQQVAASGAVNANMALPNSVGYAAGDLVLLADTGAPADCILQQVSTVAGGVMTFGGGDDYHNASAITFRPSTISIQLGSVRGNPPQLQLYGVGDDNTLFNYDLLQANGAAAAAIAEGVVEMRALYGVDSSAAPGVIDAWIDPIASSGYAAEQLADGSAAAQLKLRRIVAIRLGFVLRTSLQERDAVVPDPTTLTLFSDLGNALQQTRTITGSDTRYRFRTIELTIPLRNVLFAPAS